MTQLLASACAGRVTPRRVLQFDDAQLKAIGFSRQKAGYAMCGRTATWCWPSPRSR
jgi:hypothetical protein